MLQPYKALVLASVCACATASPATTAQPQAAKTASDTSQCSAADKSKTCRPITLVQNQDGTLELREPKEGEGIVGLVSDANTLSPSFGVTSTPTPATEPPLALKDYQHPRFEALGRMSGSDATTLERYEQWSRSQPVAPAALGDVQSWMVTFGQWIIEIPLDQTFSSAELTAAANGIGWEQIFATFAQLMPKQVANTEAAAPWRAHMWTAAGPQLQRAQEAYATCIEGKPPSVTDFCRARLAALRNLVGNSTERAELRSP